MSTDLNMEYQEVKFGDICREVKLTTKDPIADGYDKYIGLEHLDSGSLKIKRWGLIAEDNPSFTRVFKKGHILLGKRRCYLKKAAVAEFDGICSGDIIVIEANADIITKELLPFIIQKDNFWEYAVKNSSGSLSPRTKFSALANYKISLPSLDIQNEQVNILSKNLECFDLSLQTLISLKDVYEKFLEKFYEEVSHYETLPLKNVITIKHGYAYPGEEMVSFETDKIIVTPGNFLIGGGYNQGKNRFYSGEVIKDYELFPEDLIINMTDLSKECDTLGLPAFVPYSEKQYLHNQRVGLIKVNEDIVDAYYIYAFFCTKKVREKIIATATGTTVKHTSLTKLVDFEISIPPKKIQLTMKKFLQNIWKINAELLFKEHVYRKLINKI